MYSAPPPAAGWLLALLNPTVMCWPGTDAVDLYTVSCEWAASICKNNLVLLGPLSSAISPPPAPVAFSALHTSDTELRFNSQNWLSGCLMGWCWIALELDLSGRQWTVKPGYVLVVLRQCAANSSVCWLWHRLADTPGPGVIRGLQCWPLQPYHPNEYLASERILMNFACKGLRKQFQLLTDSWVISVQTLQALEWSLTLTYTAFLMSALDQWIV